MGFKVEISAIAAKDFAKLDKPVQKAVQKYLSKGELRKNPRAFGKALRYSLYGLWRYRVGDYRIIVEIRDNVLIILVLEIDHRKDIYDR